MLTHLKLSSGITLFLLITNSVFSRGIIEGTVVKTSTNYKPIQKLQVDEMVYCFDLQKNEVCLRKVLEIKQLKTNQCTGLKINNKEEILFPNTERLLLNRNDKLIWDEVASIKKSDKLCSLNAQELVFVDQELFNYSLEKDIFFYLITVDEIHNFLITEDNIIVHNAGILVPIITWEGGKVVFVGMAKMASAFFSGYLISKFKGESFSTPRLFKKEDKATINFGSDFDLTLTASGPKKPDDDKKEKCPDHTKKEIHIESDCKFDQGCDPAKTSEIDCKPHLNELNKNSIDCDYKAGCTTPTPLVVNPTVSDRVTDAAIVSGTTLAIKELFTFGKNKWFGDDKDKGK